MTVDADGNGPRLVVDEVWIVDGHQTSLVAIGQDAAKLRSGCRHPTGDYERRVPEVDEANLTSVIDAPTVAQLCGQARLAPVRHLGIARCRHLCIVAASIYKTSDTARKAWSSVLGTALKKSLDTPANHSSLRRA